MPKLSERMSGNICRCAGLPQYRSIGDRENSEEQHEAGSTIIRAPVQKQRCHPHPDATIIAGGTNLWTSWKLDGDWTRAICSTSPRLGPEHTITPTRDGGAAYRRLVRTLDLALRTYDGSRKGLCQIISSAPALALVRRVLAGATSAPTGGIY